jgi:hypothetical protein
MDRQSNERRHSQALQTNLLQQLDLFRQQQTIGTETLNQMRKLCFDQQEGFEGLIIGQRIAGTRYAYHFDDRTNGAPEMGIHLFSVTAGHCHLDAHVLLLLPKGKKAKVLRPWSGRKCLGPQFFWSAPVYAGSKYDGVVASPNAGNLTGYDIGCSG